MPGGLQKSRTWVKRLHIDQGADGCVDMTFEKMTLPHTSSLFCKAHQVTIIDGNPLKFASVPAEFFAVHCTLSL